MADETTDFKKLLHQTVIVRAMVTSKENGEIKFLDGEKIGGKDTFRSEHLKKHETGEIVEVHFQVSESTRAFLFARTLKGLTEEKASATSTTEQVVMIDQWIADFYLTEQWRRAFTLINTILDGGGILNVLVRGPSGYGKTSSFQALARHRGMNLVRKDCSTILDPEQWFGYMEARSGETVFLPTDLTMAVKSGNSIVILDEINRVEPWIANPLFPLLDDDKKASVHGQEIPVGPGTLFVMTINEGAQYAGTHQMDQALKNRVDMFLRAQKLPNAIEAELLVKRHGIDYPTAEHIVRVATALRTAVEKEGMFVDVSPRTCLKVARLVKNGSPLRGAFDLALTESADEAEIKPLADVLNTSISKK